jgi:hypothetical protein
VEVSGFDGASILIARGVISTASIARGCASGTGAIGALSLMNASDGHGCETCRACLACRANGFGCASAALYTMWPMWAAKQSIRAEILRVESLALVYETSSLSAQSVAKPLRDFFRHF